MTHPQNVPPIRPVFPTAAESPFVKSPDDEDGFFWSLEVKDPSTNRTVEATFSHCALLNSLGEDGGAYAVEKDGEENALSDIIYGEERAEGYMTERLPIR